MFVAENMLIQMYEKGLVWREDHGTEGYCLVVT